VTCGFDNDILDTVPKVGSMKENIDILDFNKIESLYSVQDIVRSKKENSQTRRKYLHIIYLIIKDLGQNIQRTFKMH
jgi:hypothetical protein